LRQARIELIRVDVFYIINLLSHSKKYIADTKDKAILQGGNKK
jgi:hypothetical protein